MTSARITSACEIGDRDPARVFAQQVDGTQDPFVDGRLGETDANEGFQDVEACIVRRRRRKPAFKQFGISRAPSAEPLAASGECRCRDAREREENAWPQDRKSTRLNSSHLGISYA